MSRPVFGKTPSPREVERIQRAAFEGVCARIDDRRAVLGRIWAADRKPEECAGCALRRHCGVRRDSRNLALRAREEGARAVGDACATARRRCPEFPFCDHVKITAETLREYGEDDA